MTKHFLDCKFRKWDRNCRDCTLENRGCRSGLFNWGNDPGDCQFQTGYSSCRDCIRENEGCCTGLIHIPPKYENE